MSRLLQALKGWRHRLTGTQVGTSQPDPGNGPVGGRAGSRSPWGHRWQTCKNGFWNGTRYLLIGAMFALLLTMIILLNEVMTFHNGIVEQVGARHARGVVLMLDEMNRNPEAYPEERALPVAELAVELDGVRRALRDLGRFSDIRPAAIEGEGRSAGAGAGGGSDGAAGEVALDDQSKTLQVRLDELRDTIYVASPFVAVASALKAFKDSVRGLSELSLVPTAEPATALDEPGAVPPSVALEGQIKRMEQELDTIARVVRPLPHAGPVSSHLANLKGEIEQLQRYQYVAARERDGTEQAGAPGGSEPERAAASIGRSAAAAVGEEGASAPDAPPGTGAPPPAEQERAEAEKAATASPQTSGAALSLIEDNMSGMESALRAAFPEFSLFSTVSDQVQTMRSQALELERVVGTENTDAADGDDDPEAAERRFDQAREELNQAIEGVETALQGRTRVVRLASVIRSNPELSAAGAAGMARTILHDFDALERFVPILMPLQWVFPADSALARIGIAPKRLATLSTDSIQTIYIFMIGAIGSLLYITRYHLQLALQGQFLGSTPTRPLPWLLFRPFFGIVVAFAVYLLVRAGQFAFGTGTEDGVGTDLNIPILSVVALFAGLLAWQALEAIEARGRVWFSSQTRKPLWASGLDHAFRTSGRTMAECSHQIGRSPEQVERWLLFRDLVPVEMQDRIRTWLEKPLDELFAEDKPKDQLGGRPMWAVGLKAALDNREQQLDEAALAELLHEERKPENRDRIRKWIDLKLQVSPAMQWQLVDLLKVPHSQLFTTTLHDRAIWAPGLRRAIERRGETARKLAERLALGVESIHAWKELETPVPTAAQDRLLSALERSFSELFEPEPKGEDWLIKANGLGAAIERKYGKRDIAAFAAAIDVDEARVQDWIDGKKAVAKGTRDTILGVLGPDPDLFSPPKIPG